MPIVFQGSAPLAGKKSGVEPKEPNPSGGNYWQSGSVAVSVVGGGVLVAVGGGTTYTKLDGLRCRPKPRLGQTRESEWRVYKLKAQRKFD